MKPWGVSARIVLNPVELVGSTGAVPPTATNIDIGWRVQLHSMTGPRAVELNGAVARVRGEKFRLSLCMPADRAEQPWISGGEEGKVVEAWAVELESGSKSQVYVKPANLAPVCAHVPCRALLHAPKVCSKCQVASECPQPSSRLCV